MVKFLVIFLNIFFIAQCYSQRSAHWCFGDSIHLQFNASGLQAVAPSAFFGHEAVSTISDENGNLLMYSNGKNIWDSEHNLMPNGSDLLVVPWIPDLDVFVSETQGSMILPDPGSSLRYYVFSKHSYSGLSNNYFFYSLVDMSLRSGLGDVVEDERTVLLLDSSFAGGSIFSEKLNAVKHANGRDWWVILYSTSKGPFMPDSTIYKFLVSPAGIEFVGLQFIPRFSSSNDGIGEMVFSQQGDKVAFGSDNNLLRVFEFERCSGSVGDVIFVDTLANTVYSNEFSPDGTKLYVSQLYNFSTDLHGKIIQYDLENIGQPGFKQIIYSTPDSIQNGQLQLGPDGKIYLAAVKGLCFWPSCNDDLTSSWSDNISVINSPNSSGMACNLQPHSVSTGGRRVFIGLPNQPNYSLGAIEGSPCDTLGVSSHIDMVGEQEISISPNPVSKQGEIILDLPFYATASQYRIHNLNGQVVLQGRLDSKTIDIVNLDAGIYQIRIQSADKVYRSRFVVQ